MLGRISGEAAIDPPLVRISAAERARLRAVLDEVGLGGLSSGCEGRPSS